MKILALDIATKTGFATDMASGVWDLKLKKGESNGMKLIRLNSKVREVVESLNIDLVVMERPAGLFKSAIITESELIGVVKLYCEEKNINYTEYSATEIKKFFTGKGNAKKADMIEEAKRRFPEINIIDDNHADALALLELAKLDLK